MISSFPFPQSALPLLGQWSERPGSDLGRAPAKVAIRASYRLVLGRGGTHAANRSMTASAGRKGCCPAIPLGLAKQQGLGRQAVQSEAIPSAFVPRVKAAVRKT
jgi:hypothetical protein